MARRWQCTVCGYIHVGPEPPEVCPVCGADRSKFIPLDAPASSLWRAMHATFRVHPVAAHFPGGLIPAAALFLPISIVLGNAALESAVFWLILLATAVVPVSVGSGIHDWRKYFGGRRAPIFFKKLGLAATLFTLGLLALFLRYGPPELAAVPGWPRVLWLALLAGMLACVVLLGHYGALLAAQRRDAQPSPEQPVSSDPGHDWARGIVTEAADAILAADTTGTIRLWNRGAERIFGVPAAAAIGQSLDLVIPESLRQRHWEGWGRVMRSGESRYGTELLRVPAIRGDGSRFSAEFSIVMLKDAAGKVTGVAAILRDVSEQWEREKRLKEQLASH